MTGFCRYAECTLLHHATRVCGGIAVFPYGVSLYGWDVDYAHFP